MTDIQRKKIKLDLSSYLSNERNIDFRGYEESVKKIITDLVSSKDNVSSMTGWLNLPHNHDEFINIHNFIQSELKKDIYEHLIVIGIGGSSLGPQALLDSINTPNWNRLSSGKRKGFLTVDYIDNLDPQIIRTVYSRLKLDKTLFLIVSKGGGTIETIAPMLIAKEWVGPNFYKQCVFVTTLNKGLLYEIGKKENVKIFSIPENVGGRFSIFSPVGMLPAAFCGLNLNEILSGIKDGDTISRNLDLKSNLAAQIALAAYFSYRNGRNIFVLMPYSTCMRKFVDWFVQLWAESLGKEQKGSTPICAIGATDQHSQIQMFNEGPNDKLISFIKIAKHKRDMTIPNYSSEHPEFSIYANKQIGKILNIELDATRRALTERKRPNFLITLPELDEYYISQLMYILEMSTAITGKLLEINPFDQPGVELAKKYTKEALMV